MNPIWQFPSVTPSASKSKHKIITVDENMSCVYYRGSGKVGRKKRKGEKIKRKEEEERIKKNVEQEREKEERRYVPSKMCVK